jgi:hypothetical protein
MEPYNKSATFTQTCIRRNIGKSVLSRTDVSLGRSLLGYKNPNWREQVREHRSATTPCSGTFRGLDPGYVEVSAIRRKVPPDGTPDIDYLEYGELWNTTSGYPAVPALPTASVENVALTRFYQSANNQINQASGMIALGELRETVRQLKHPFKSLTDLLKTRERKLKGKWNRLNAVRLAGNKRKRKILGRDFKNAAAGTWLEAQLAIQPLAHDIEDIVTYLQFRRFQVGVEYLPIRSKYEVISRSVDSLTWVEPSISSVWIYINRERKTISKVKYKGQIKVDPLNSWVDWRDFSRLGLSLRQFLPTLYEITPWSFVLDYFVDVGGLIESFNVPREDIAWFNKTSRSESQVNLTQGKPSAAFLGSGYRIDLGASFFRPATGVASQFTRSGGSTFSLPRPSIVLDLPNGKQFVNLVALALSDSRQRFSFSL